MHVWVVMRAGAGLFWSGGAGAVRGACARFKGLTTYYLLLTTHYLLLTTYEGGMSSGLEHPVGA